MPWVLREVAKSGGGLLREVHVDAELRRVFAELLGETLEYMLGPALGAAAPLDQERLAKVNELFALDLDWNDAAWFLEEMRDTPMPDR